MNGIQFFSAGYKVELNCLVGAAGDQLQSESRRWITPLQSSPDYNIALHTRSMKLPRGSFREAPSLSGTQRFLVVDPNVSLLLVLRQRTPDSFLLLQQILETSF